MSPLFLVWILWKDGCGFYVFCAAKQQKTEYFKCCHFDSPYFSGHLNQALGGTNCFWFQGWGLREYCILIENGNRSNKIWWSGSGLFCPKADSNGNLDNFSFAAAVLKSRYHFLLFFAHLCFVIVEVWFILVYYIWNFGSWFTKLSRVD